MRKPSIYIDTSVVSAYLDEKVPDRWRLTKEFWDDLFLYEVYTSVITLREVEANKSAAIKKKMKDLMEDFEVLELTQEVLDLAKKYIEEGIIPQKFENDALHIAIASVNRVEYLLSWNFKHIVKVKTRRMVNLVNLSLGFSEIELISPPEL